MSDRSEHGRYGKSSRFTCFFGGRLNRGAKRSDVMLREYDSLFRFGRDIDITICSPKDEGWVLEAIREEYPEISVLTNVGSDEFLRRAAQAHVYFSTSAHEGFSVGAVEMLYMTKYGTVFVGPRLDWMEGLLGKEAFEEYPFLYEDFTQARVMLRHIHENHEDAAKQVEWVSDLMRERYDVMDTAELHYDHFRTVVDTELDESFVRTLMGPGTVALTKEAFDALSDEFGLDELYDEMIQRSRAMKSEPRRGQTTKWAVRRWLIVHGYADDTYSTAIPRMRKTGKEIPAVEA